MYSYKTFIDFFYERYISEEIDSSDSKGKLHEILVAKHLHPNKELPTHYRNIETQKTPKITHDDIVSIHMSVPDRKGNTGIHHEDYVAADKRAKEAADHIKEHLKSNGYDTNRIHSIAWTSNKKDHKEFTGVEDPNSDADVMMHLHKHGDDDSHPGHHVGLSLKVGGGKPNVRNPGLKTLNSLTGADEKVINSSLEKHKQNLHNLGYDQNKSAAENHEQYKADIGRKGVVGVNKERALSAEKSSLVAKNEMASHYAESINKLHKGHVEHLMKSLVAPETKFKHFRVHTKVSNNGTTQHLEDHQSEFNKKLIKHGEHGYVAHSSGQSIHIHAKNPDGSKGKRMASIVLKSSSGPVKGIVGSVKE